MYFASNIQFLRKRRGRSQEEMACALDIKRSTLGGYEHGIEPNYRTLMQISDYFRIPVDKLLREDLRAWGEHKLSVLENSDPEGHSLRILATTVDSNNRDNIELVPKKAKAGYTDGYADPDYIKILQCFNLPFLDRSRKYRTFQITGDSMPPVPDGSWVTGAYVQNWRSIKDGRPYVVVTRDEGIVFKMLYNRLKEEGSLLLCSTNPAYAPYSVEAAQVAEVWQFTHFISSEL